MLTTNHYLFQAHQQREKLLKMTPFLAPLAVHRPDVRKMLQEA